MKIAVTSALGWPYIRRGNRVAYELAVYLADRGHQVHFITTKPGRIGRHKKKSNLLIQFHPLIDHPFLAKFKIWYLQSFFITCFRALLRGNYDIVYTSLTADAVAASLNKSIKGTPFISVLINGDPLYKDAPFAKPFFPRVVKTASRLVTISHFVNDILKREYGAEGVVIPCPVDRSKFSFNGKKPTDTPRILCTAALTTPRKRVPLLVKAFEKLIIQIPNAVLQLAGETNPETTRNLLISVNPKTRNSIELLEITSDEVLASYYREATISVLPSLNEPFGMVTTESLASGTPVVGTKSGGTIEILNDPRVGVLFEPTDGPDELCKALIEGIELAHNPLTSMRCSEHAEKYSWNILGPKYEEMQIEVLDTIKKRDRPIKKIIEKKTTSQKISNNVSPVFTQVDKKRLDKFFVDTLDELEITTSAYYEIESSKPRCLYILKWLLTKGMNKGNVLVLSTYPHFLTTLLKKLKFNVREIIINNRFNAEKGFDDHKMLSAPLMLSDLRESFDFIICDDLLQYLAIPDVILQALKQLLKPKGIFILTTPNVARGNARIRLLLGRNIYPHFGDSLLSKGSLDLNIKNLAFYREYTLCEVENLALQNSFTVIKKMRIFGKKTVDKNISFSHVSLKTYFIRKIYNQFQRIFRPFRSHLFIAAGKS